MERNDDKSRREAPRATSRAARDFEIGMAVAQAEPRARASCGLAVMHIMYLGGEWRTDKCLRDLLIHVIDLNVDAGICEGMLDHEVATLQSMRAALGEGGAA